MSTFIVGEETFKLRNINPTNFHRQGIGKDGIGTEDFVIIHAFLGNESLLEY